MAVDKQSPSNMSFRQPAEKNGQNLSKSCFAKLQACYRRRLEAVSAAKVDSSPD